MGGLCSGTPNKTKNKVVKREKEKEREIRRKAIEESKDNNIQVSSFRRASNPRIIPSTRNNVLLDNHNGSNYNNAMNNDIRVNNINNHFTDLNQNIALSNQIPSLNSNRILFDSQSLRNNNNHNHILLSRQNTNLNNLANNNNNDLTNANHSDRTNNINFNNFDRGSNNMINISINDELSSRRNLQTINCNNNNANQIGFSLSGGRAFNNNRMENTGSISLGSRRLSCQICRASFGTEREYDIHVMTCRDFRNNRMMHNISEILQLVQSINRHFQFEGRLNSLAFLGLDEPEDAFDFIDWNYCKESEIWKNEGKINISSEELKKISQTEIALVKNLKFWQKRLWFLNYINKHVYDKSSDNTTLVVSRENILEESFNQFMTTHDLDLKKSMQIFFVDEAAIDIGGVYREWYSSLFEAIFSDKNGFFFKITESDKGKHTFFIPIDTFNCNDKTFEEVLFYYEFIGKIMGKALFDKITIKGNFNKIILKLLMGEKVDLDDLEHFDKSFYSSLKGMLNCPITENDFNFTWNVKINGSLETVELIENGENIFVIDSNKKDFVEKVVEYLTYTSIKEKVDAMKKGFYSVIPKEIVNIFHSYEMDFLFSGQGEIDLEDWKANTIYKGNYHENHPVIKDFWDIMTELKKEDLLVFYRFCTGCTRVPIDGFASLQGTRNKYQKFCIESPSAILASGSINRLIEANTCFNRIYLPQYESKEIMREIIYKVLENDTNYFGKQ